MKLQVKTLSEPTLSFKIDVTPDASVVHLRGLVAEEFNLPSRRIRLVFGGRILNDGETLGAFNLDENASVIAIFGKSSPHFSASHSRISIRDSPEQPEVVEKDAKRAKLCFEKGNLDILVGEFICQVYDVPKESVNLKHVDRLVDAGDTLGYLEIPGVLSSDSSNDSSNLSRSSSGRFLIIRVTKENSSSSLSFEIVCEVEKSKHFLTASFLQVKPCDIKLESIPIQSNRSNGHFVRETADFGDFSNANFAFFYDGTAKFIRRLVSKENNVKPYLVYLEIDGKPLQDEDSLNVRCVHKNTSNAEHRLRYRCFRSCSEELAWRLNKEVCSSGEFLSYAVGFPGIQGIISNPDNIRKMLLTYPMLKRLYKTSQAIERILNWNDYLHYRVNIFNYSNYNPSVDQIFADPAGWNRLLLDYPAVQQLYHLHPEIRQILMWDEYLSHVMANPSFSSVHQEITRSQDLALAQIEQYSEYGDFMLNVTGESSNNYLAASPSEFQCHQNQRSAGARKSSDDDKYLHNISKFVCKLLKNSPEFGDALVCNRFMQSFIDSVASDSRLVNGMIEEVSPSALDNPAMLSWARKKIQEILKQLCSQEGRENFIVQTIDKTPAPRVQIQIGLEILREAGYPVSEILDIEMK